MRCEQRRSDCCIASVPGSVSRSRSPGDRPPVVWWTTNPPPVSTSGRACPPSGIVAGLAPAGHDRSDPGEVPAEVLYASDSAAMRAKHLVQLRSVSPAPHPSPACPPRPASTAAADRPPAPDSA